MDLSKPFTDWNEEELTMAVSTFSNWHNARYFTSSVCKFKREDLFDWVKSLLPDLKDLAVTTRYSNHLIISWLKSKLIRVEGREFIAMIGEVVDDEYWMICGQRVDRIGLLTVLRHKRGVEGFTFEHHRVEKTTTFDGALRIAGFSVEDIATMVAASEPRRHGHGAPSVEEAREIQRDRDVQ